MKLPIIIDEHGNVSIYRTLADAELDLEVIDVKNGEFVAYDASGNLLDLEINVTKKTLFSIIKTSVESVRISDSCGEQDHENDLKALLIYFIKRSGRFKPEHLELPLDELIGEAISLFGYSS